MGARNIEPCFNCQRNCQKNWSRSGRQPIVLSLSSERGGTEGKTTIDTHFYISSLDVEPNLAFRSVRQHWYTENQQHWVLDVVFREDQNQIGDREVAERMALFRRIVLNLAQQHPAKSSKKLKIKRRAGATILGQSCSLVDGINKVKSGPATSILSPHVSELRS